MVSDDSTSRVMVLPVTVMMLAIAHDLMRVAWWLTSLDEDLHTATKAEDKVEGGLLLDVVIGKSTSIFKLLAGEDQTLLVRRNAFLVLDLALDVVDGIRRLHLKGDRLTGDCEAVSGRRCKEWRRRRDLRVLTKICMVVVVL